MNHKCLKKWMRLQENVGEGGGEKSGVSDVEKRDVERRNKT